MEIVKSTDEYQIIKKRSGRYGVRGADRKWITGDEKVKILAAEGLIKAAAPKEEQGPPEQEAPPQEAPTEASDEEAAAKEEEKPEG